MREEYQAIVAAGFLVQVDDLRLSIPKRASPNAANGRKFVPPGKFRFHTCYGIIMGPRVHDMELNVDIIMKTRAGAYSFEAANPRREHEWKVWKNVKLPEGKILTPGMISHSTILVEHPELVAERIVRYANIVGRENVIAGSDCGFATFAGSKEVHPSIVGAKFKALSDGAQIASKELCGRG
jgi:5-methyltetrahydropteroyltriglutamate--homocysteine methyltransferase